MIDERKIVARAYCACGIEIISFDHKTWMHYDDPKDCTRVDDWNKKVRERGDNG